MTSDPRSPSESFWLTFLAAELRRLVDEPHTAPQARRALAAYSDWDATQRRLVDLNQQELSL